MTKRRYKFTVTDMDALAAAYPQAVEETIIPARVERKASYSYIAKLLDLNLPVAGIEVDDDAAPADTTTDESEVPDALRGLVSRTL